MIYLFDVNVLLAMIDTEHVHHERVHKWLSKLGKRLGWATCALTENGFCRVVSTASYPNHSSPAEAVAMLSEMRKQLPGHQFWPCGLSLTDRSKFSAGILQGPKQLTDVYLLGLAVQQNGRLATFDQRIRTSHVTGARQDHLFVI